MENTREKESSHESNDETKKKSAIEKGIKFWKHPSLASVSADEKKAYLSSRGLSESDIHTVWERLAAEEQETVTPSQQQQQATAPAASTEATAMPPPSNVPPPLMNQQYPQRQQPYYQPQQQQYSSSMYHSDEDAPTSVMDVAALMTVGGAIGLTAAAAVRWLNGGDFVIFPSPTQRTIEQDGIMNEETVNMERANASVTEHHHHVEDEHVEDNHDYYQDFPQQEAMQDILERLEVHCEKQDAILQHLSNQATKHVTDQSMDLLRNHSSVSNGASSTVAQELHGIREQLEKLSINETSEELQEQLQACLTELQECMTKVNSESGVNDGTFTQAAAVNSSLPPIQPSRDTTPTTVPSSSSPSLETSKSAMLRHAITRLAQENGATSLAAGTQLLYLYVVNLSSHPHVPRYRKIFTTNESFQKVQSLHGGTDLLLAVGFEEDGNCLQWQGDEDTVLLLKEAAAALSILKSSHVEQDSAQLAQSAVSVLRPRTPPPSASLPVSSFKTPDFIASPPATKKVTLLDETGEDSILDISHASEHFESRLESLAQPVISEFGTETGNSVLSDVPQTNLSMRESEQGDESSDHVTGGDEN